MKPIKVLCFGDSNTWGMRPENSRDYGSEHGSEHGARESRYPKGARWTGLLEDCLNTYSLEDNITGGFEVIEAGQPNRTLVHNAPFEGDKSGLVYLKPLLEQAKPDILILLLGTNDLKAKFCLSAKAIAQGAGRLIEQVQGSASAPKRLILIAPPKIQEVAPYLSIYAGGALKSQGLASEYDAQTQHLGCEFLDAGALIKSSELDGIHWSEAAHAQLAQAIGKSILAKENEP